MQIGLGERMRSAGLRRWRLIRFGVVIRGYGPFVRQQICEHLLTQAMLGQSERVMYDVLRAVLMLLGEGDSDLLDEAALFLGEARETLIGTLPLASSGTSKQRLGLTPIRTSF